MDISGKPITSARPKRIKDKHGNMDNGMFKILNRGSSRRGGDPWEGVESKLQSKSVKDIKREEEANYEQSGGKTLVNTQYMIINGDMDSKGENGRRMGDQPIKTWSLMKQSLRNRFGNKELSQAKIEESLKIHIEDETTKEEPCCIMNKKSVEMKEKERMEEKERSNFEDSSKDEDTKLAYIVMNNASIQSIVVGFGLDDALFDILHDKCLGKFVENVGYVYLSLILLWIIIMILFP
ncbi:hypothetical protein M9H77_31166 [Catharanthus roseus]|uniref:Uncharacterized protein n=1 Tax=Catharanthus roseus TaxID=4058 RepID=A0ACB9ZZM7_CATRO|nr:hypothetical protein M9H77_31166 [Catharanthus roseus]